MYNVRPTRSFERDAKPLIKKYVSLRQELAKVKAVGQGLLLI